MTDPRKGIAMGLLFLFLGRYLRKTFSEALRGLKTELHAFECISTLQGMESKIRRFPGL